jgi:hypothetical protein
MDNLEGYVNDDALAYAPLRALGWDVEAIPWRRPGVDWSRFRIVVIRSTWDNQHAPAAFLAALDQIRQSGARLENPLDLVRWNLEKTYLRDLEQRGVPIVPTVWGSEVGRVDESALRERLVADEVVLKPLIGANADHTYRLAPGSPAWAEAAATFELRAFLAQPFLPGVVTEGEYSLFFFAGQFSHAVLKTPRPSDFRVQEEHGGRIRSISPACELMAAGEGAMAAIGQVPLYARADFIRLGQGGFVLMELELIEPSLYLRMDEGAAERFASAVDRSCRPTGG